jgi:Icc-related predicted phosphoesterase
VRIAALHFAPTTTTLGREPLTKYWMLGNCELGIVLDRRPPDLVIHGHAHLGTLRGRTPGGVPVRNVALPVVGRVHLEVLEESVRGYGRAPERLPLARWR